MLAVRKLVTLITFMLLCLTSVEAQDTTSVRKNLTDYVRTAIAFNKVFPQEKVYLHFDNTGYFKEETIYFKAYVVRTDKSTLSDISKVLYVELLTPVGDVIQTQKIKLDNGQGAGSIHLTDLLDNGFYEVRAYTRYMTNWDANGIFSRVFPIFGKPKKEGDYTDCEINPELGRDAPADKLVKDSVRARKINIRFFPEGGTVVQGLECRTAFEITDINGKRLDNVSCNLLDANGQRIVENIHPLQDGRGVFVYSPTAAPLYFEVTGAKGTTRKVEMPAAQPEGCALQVNAVTGQNVTAQLAVSPGMHARKWGVVLCRNGVVMAFDTIRTNKDTPVTVEYPRNEIPNGVNQITVFDETGRIYADRMFFIYHPEEQDSIRIDLANTYLAPCKKVKMTAHTLPNTTFSLSVMDAETTTNGYGQNALTWMLLTSDLKGFIAHPSYYFEKDDREHRRAADLLMMVQGWRRYRWNQLSGVEPFQKKQPIEDGLYIDGQLHQARKKNTVAQVELSAYLYNKGGEHYSGSTLTDQDGYYAFHLPDCNGEFTLLMKTKKEEKDTKYYVGIDRNFSPDIRPYSYYESQLLPPENPRDSLREVEIAEEERPQQKVIKVGDNDMLIPTVTVKRRRIFENARAAWETEKRGQYRASIYYDCQKEADKIADRGERIPTFMTWIAHRSPLISTGGDTHGGGNDVANATSVETQLLEGTAVEDVQLDASAVKVTDTNGDLVANAGVYNDGLRINNRPVVWILANVYKMVTGSTRNAMTFQTGTQYSDEDMPMDLDEVKSVYISTNENAWKPYVASSDLGDSHPVTVFVYPLRSFWKSVKGLRRTTFRGYNTVETFEMNDYDQIPPEADYRRTLFWEPDVQTDANGNANIEFWNNSQCTQILISAEGITQEGKAIVY
jgi:hypothetical protein